MTVWTVWEFHFPKLRWNAAGPCYDDDLWGIPETNSKKHLKHEVCKLSFLRIWYNLGDASCLQEKGVFHIVGNWTSYPGTRHNQETSGKIMSQPYWLKEGFCWRRFLRRSSPCHLSSGAAMLVILFFLLLLLLLWSDYACVTTVWRCGVHMCTCIHTYLLIYIHSNLPRNLHTKLLIYLPVYLHAYVHACIRAYDTQIHAYMVAQERYSFPILSGYYRHAPKTFSVPACKG